MSGIIRINITSHNDMGWRMQMAKDHEPLLNSIYREIFPDLADGDETVNVTKEEAMARYDHKEGVDVILQTKSGMRFTLQEKVLTFHRSTITFEEVKTSGAPGAWYYCTAQLYFIAYNRRYKDEGVIEFQDWMMINFTGIRLEDIKGNVPWGFSQNGYDGRRAVFRHVHFFDVPKSCIYAQKRL